MHLLLSGPKSSAGRPMPDGRQPEPGGWNRIHFVVAYCAWRLLVPAGWQRARNASRRRWLGYLGLGAAASASVGPWLVLLILGCGLIELRRRLEVRRWGCR